MYRCCSLDSLSKLELKIETIFFNCSKIKHFISCKRTSWDETCDSFCNALHSFLPVFITIERAATAMEALQQKKVTDSTLAQTFYRQSSNFGLT